jgi:nitrate reductase gamma subunit
MVYEIDEIDNIISNFIYEIINYISISQCQGPELYNYVLDKHYDWKHTCRQKLNFMYFF